ncbi:hypothetical protein NQ315_012756 [Exocentrus adspersus]|uniref:Folded gastrulation N-terminal domain-containing protein n=1 Tax=Exocentrus adspersus TaxID=1586481 RepID=A0AAV8V6E5_9CUCU|nr:hypothetical protein NQ315_012756 [Exocentrus adspersus]
METCKCIIILLLYSITAAYCYPSKPLNERSPSDLTWQAWLLVDDQNQNKQQTNSDGGLRRRITPKSVFISPSFNPEALPACADGYMSDVMGRCVPIIKIAEESQYGFLIEKIKQKFDFDYDYSAEEETSTQGPLQINIPLQVNEGDEDETDVAIVISPTNAFGVSLDKRDSIDDEKKQEFFLKNLAAGTSTKQPDETTTFSESITVPYNEEVSAITEDLGSVTEPLATTEEHFATSTDSHNTKRSTNPQDTDMTTIEELPDTTTESITTSTEELSTSSVKVVARTESHTTTTPFKFPEDLETKNFKNTLVKFPDTDISFQTQIPSSVELNPSTRDVSKGAVSIQATDISASDHKVVFPGESQPEESNLDYSNGVRHLPSTTTPVSFNRRNRDKPGSMFLLPPRWSQPNFQKPLVLRFSRKHAYFDETQFKRPEFYRSVPMDDYAFLFNKHKHLTHR